MTTSNEFPRGWVVTALANATSGAAVITRPGVPGVTQVITDLFAKLITGQSELQAWASAAGGSTAAITIAAPGGAAITLDSVSFRLTANNAAAVSNTAEIFNNAASVAVQNMQAPANGSDEWSSEITALIPAGNTLKVQFANAAAANTMQSITIRYHLGNQFVTDTVSLLAVSTGNQIVEGALAVESPGSDTWDISDAEIGIPIGDGFTFQFNQNTDGVTIQSLTVKGYDF